MSTDYAAWAARVESALEHALPGIDHEPRRLHAAMRHAVLGGGKRMRPLLVYAAGRVAGAAETLLDAPAAAVEMIHAYSLVHDDLPAMDDDALRRGQPTVHVAFDEATAILAGDALQTRAFEILASAGVTADVRLDWVRTLASASGVAGMCGGQALDIDATGRAQSLDELARMHAWKTGALIRAAVRMGAQAGSADDALLDTLDEFASALGLAFQIRDDLLDVEATSEQLGKTAGKDVAQSKSTYPALLGLDGARAHLHAQRERMRQALAPFGAQADALRGLGEMAVQRAY